MTPASERPDTVNRSKPVYGLTGRMREKRGLPDDGVSGAAVTPAPERPDLDAAWAELLLDACASDGPIRDNDVRQAIIRNRPRIEALAAPVTDVGLREAQTLLNSLGIVGPNIRHVEQGVWPDGKVSDGDTWDGPGWCVCGRIWPCEAKRLGDILAALSRQAEEETAGTVTEKHV